VGEDLEGKFGGESLRICVRNAARSVETRWAYPNDVELEQGGDLLLDECEARPRQRSQQLES
jgi:hypothetical protein